MAQSHLSNCFKCAHKKRQELKYTSISLNQLFQKNKKYTRYTNTLYLRAPTFVTLATVASVSIKEDTNSNITQSHGHLQMSSCLHENTQILKYTNSQIHNLKS